MYRSSPLRSTLNTGYIRFGHVFKVCTEALDMPEVCISCSVSFSAQNVSKNNPPPPDARNRTPSVRNAHKHPISIGEYVWKNARERGVGGNNNNNNNNNNNRRKLWWRETPVVVKRSVTVNIFGHFVGVTEGKESDVRFNTVLRSYKHPPTQSSQFT